MDATANHTIPYMVLYHTIPYMVLSSSCEHNSKSSLCSLNLFRLCYRQKTANLVHNQNYGRVNINIDLTPCSDAVMPLKL